MSDPRDIGDVGTVSIVHYFFNLTADSNSPTRKTTRSKFSTHGSVHALRTYYSLDCREGHMKEKFVCLLVCLQIHGRSIFARWMQFGEFSRIPYLVFGVEESESDVRFSKFRNTVER